MTGMRFGPEPGPWRFLPWLLTLGLLGLAVGVGLWGRQQDLARRAAENRADAAEARLATAEATMSAVALASAAPPSTPVPASGEPETALRHALDLVFDAYRDPSDGKLRALSDAFSPEALSFERTEAEHLISGGMHLAGETPYELRVLSASTPGAGDAQISTHEIWTYDEVDGQNRRMRCFREESEQTYNLHRGSGGWLVQDVELNGSPRRTDC